jgi:hypothetical protein
MVTKGRELVASFIWEGETPERGRKVMLSKTSEGYLISVQGMPELRRSFSKREESKALSTFRHIHEASWKDWGASEIDWRKKRAKKDGSKKRRKRRKRKIKTLKPVKTRSVEIKTAAAPTGIAPFFRMLTGRGTSIGVTEEVPPRKMLPPGR